MAEAAVLDAPSARQVNFACRYISKILILKPLSSAFLKTAPFGTGRDGEYSEPSLKEGGNLHRPTAVVGVACRLPVGLCPGVPAPSDWRVKLRGSIRPGPFAEITASRPHPGVTLSFERE